MTVNFAMKKGRAAASRHLKPALPNRCDSLQGASNATFTHVIFQKADSFPAGSRAYIKRLSPPLCIDHLNTTSEIPYRLNV